MKTIYIPALILYFCLSGALFSQSPPCRPDDHGLSFMIEDNQGSLPLSIYMPLNVIQSYIYLDSLNHSVTLSEFHNLLNRQVGYSDTIRTILKHYLINNDYDPIRFYLFLLLIDKDFSIQRVLITREMKSILEQVSPDFIFDYMALYSHAIMHLKVDDVIVRNNPFWGDSVVIASCTIIDTISGRIIPGCKDLEVPNIPDEFIVAEPVTKLALPGECIQFNYSFHYMPFSNWLKKGGEYIVFLTLTNVCRDSNLVYFNLSPRFNYSESYGMFPVVDGKVIDPANELKLGVETDVEEFKKGLRERLGKIKNFEPLDVIEEIPEYISENEIKSFPNPFSGETSLVFNIAEPGSQVELNIYNQMGNKVYSERFISDTHGTNIKTISLDGQPSGAYYCTISTRNGYAGGKLLLIK